MPGITTAVRRSGRVCLIVHEIDRGQRFDAAVFVPVRIAHRIGRTLQTLIRIAGLDAAPVDGHPVWCESAPDHDLMPNWPVHELHVGGDFHVGNQVVSFSLSQDPGQFDGQPYVHFVADGWYADAGVRLQLRDAAHLAEQLVAVRAPRRLAVAA
jgi:hypothetical protein